MCGLPWLALIAAAAALPAAAADMAPSPAGTDAPACFAASGRIGDDAQTIRLKAEAMGWTVGVPASLTAAAVIRGKVALYPKGTIAVCLSDAAGGGLTIRAQASTSDDRRAEWRRLPAKKLAAASRATGRAM